MQKKMLAILFGALVIGLLTTSSGLGQTITVSGKVIRNTGGSDWSTAWARRVINDQQPGKTSRVSFSASGYYSGLKCTKGPKDNKYKIWAAAEDESIPGIVDHWLGVELFSSSETKIVNIMALKLIGLE